MRSKNIFKCLEMMGYEVRDEGHFNHIRIGFRGNNGFVCWTIVDRIELENSDFIVEEIIHRLNEYIRREL